jgi:hypothetical protein
MAAAITVWTAAWMGPGMPFWCALSLLMVVGLLPLLEQCRCRCPKSDSRRQEAGKIIDEINQLRITDSLEKISGSWNETVDFVADMVEEIREGQQKDDAADRRKDEPHSKPPDLPPPEENR